MKVQIFDDGFEGFVQRSNERAKKRARGERIEPVKNITFADAEDMAECLTAQRVRLFQAAKVKQMSISALAETLGRNRGSVTRDVNTLRRYGLIELRETVNPGHGKVQLVYPVAKKIEMHLAL